MYKWKNIWNNEERINKIILETLIKLDGFDTGFGNFNVNNWIEYTTQIYNKLEIKKNNSIFDVGCGSGAFIFPLYLKKHKVGGIDYSLPLIDIANKIMKNSDFSVNEAINLDTKIQYDFVISHSVFNYFKDLKYAESVIKKMIKKSKYKIGIFDINDKSKEKIYNKIRMEHMSKEEYEKKYKGLNHMFFDKDWFLQFEKKYNLKISIFDQEYKKYANSVFRFNVIMIKNSK